MNYKVVRDSSGAVVAFGPNCVEYEHVIAPGHVLSIVDEIPILPIVDAAPASPVEKLKAFLSETPDVAALIA